jgi:hypothetical protein
VFPLPQGTLDGNGIARLKFSQPERLHGQFLIVSMWLVYRSTRTYDWHE